MSSRKTLTAAAAALVLAGGALAWQGLAGAPAAVADRLAVADHRRAVAAAHSPPAPTRPVSAPHTSAASPPATSTAAATTTAAAPAWHPSLPGQVGTIAIPALQVTAPVLAEGPQGGVLPIPPDVHQVAWDSQTAAPGKPGVTVIAGHVNWVGQGTGALGDIGQLVPGDLVSVNWRGHASHWRVSTPARLSPNAVAHPGLFSRSGPPRLALVTCGGPFSETSHGGRYADNVIVLAVPTT